MSKQRGNKTPASYLRLAVVLDLGQVVSKLLHTLLQLWSFRVCIHAYFSNQDIGLVPESGCFTHVGGEQLAHLSEVFLHVGDVFLDLSRLVVPGEKQRE